MGKYGRRSRRRISDKRKITLKRKYRNRKTLKRKYRNRKTLKRKRNKKTLKQMGGMFRKKITLQSVFEKFGSKSITNESDLYNKLVTLFKHNYVLAPAVVLYKDINGLLRFIVVSNMSNSTQFTTDQSNKLQMRKMESPRLNELNSGSSKFKLESSIPLTVYTFNFKSNKPNELLNLFTINTGNKQIKPKYLIVANDENIVYYTDKNNDPTIVAYINPSLDSGLEIFHQPHHINFVFQKFGSSITNESDLTNKLVTLFKHNYVLAPAVVLYKDINGLLRFIVVSNIDNSTKFITDQSNELQMRKMESPRLNELNSGSSKFKLEGSDPVQVQVFLFNLINNSSDLLNLFTINTDNKQINTGNIQIKPKYLIVANDENIVYYTDKNNDPTIVANITPSLDSGLEIVYPDMFPHDNSKNYFMMDYLLKNLKKNPGSFPTDTLSKEREIEQLEPTDNGHWTDLKQIEKNVSSDVYPLSSTVIISNKNGKYTLSQMYNGTQSEIVHSRFTDTQSSKFNFVRTIAELRELFFDDPVSDNTTALVFVNNGYFYYITKTFVVEYSGLYADEYGDDGVIELSDLTGGISYLNFELSEINSIFTDVNYFLKAQFNSNILDNLYPCVYVFNSMNGGIRSKNFIIICYKEKESGILKYVEYKLDIKDIVNLICPFKLFETILKRYELDESISEIKEKVGYTFKSMIFALKTAISKKWTEFNTNFYYIRNEESFEGFEGLVGSNESTTEKKFEFSPVTPLEIDKFYDRLNKKKVKISEIIPEGYHTNVTIEQAKTSLSSDIKALSYIIIQTEDTKYKLMIRLPNNKDELKVKSLEIKKFKLERHVSPKGHKFREPVTDSFVFKIENIEIGNTKTQPFNSLITLVAYLNIYPFTIIDKWETRSRKSGVVNKSIKSEEYNDYYLLGEPMKNEEEILGFGYDTGYADNIGKAKEAMPTVAEVETFTPVAPPTPKIPEAKPDSKAQSSWDRTLDEINEQFAAGKDTSEFFSYS